MHVFLIVQRTSQPAQQLRLADITLVGRGKECNLRIASNQVSRRHCRIEVTARGVTVCDLGSSNGTEIDGVAIPPHVNVSVEPGAKLSIGPMRFVFEFELSRTRTPQPEESTRVLSLRELGQHTGAESVDFILTPTNPESPPPDATSSTFNQTMTDKEVADIQAENSAKTGKTESA